MVREEVILGKVGMIPDMNWIEILFLNCLAVQELGRYSSFLLLQVGSQEQSSYSAKLSRKN